MDFRVRTTPLGIVSAVVVAMCVIFPFFIQDKPYDDDVLHYWTLGGTIAVVFALAFALLPIRALREAPGVAARLLLRPSPLVFAVIVGAVTAGLSLFFAGYAFSSGISTSDEVAQLWHAKMIVNGFLSLPADPNPEFFAIDNVIDTGRWYSHFPIGGPLALVPGVWLGVPYLVNPLFAGLSAAAVSHFARVAFGELQGRAAAALFSVTTMVLLMAGTYMNHLPVLCFATAALAMLVEWDRATSRRAGMRWAAGIGLALGAIATIRPLDAVVAASVVGLFQLRTVWLDRSRARELLVQGIVGAIAVAPLLYANAVMNGGPLRFGYDVMWGAGHRIGFHADPRGQVHTFSRAVLYASTYVSELNFALVSWPLPAMALVFVGLAAMKRMTRWDALVVGFFLAQVAAYAAYWGLGEFLGPRFLFTALPMVIIILARTPFLVAEYEGPAAGRFFGALIVACAVIAWAPSWAPTSSPYSVWGTADRVRMSRRAMRLDVGGIVREAGVKNALVFVREPFASRILHRLWGLGVGRGGAADMLATRDACSLLAAVRKAETSTTLSVAARATLVDSLAERLPWVAGQAIVNDPTARLSSPQSLTETCRQEIDDSKLVPGSFGAALPLQHINDDGRIGGNVVYANDLSEHNEALRKRFADRTWYRLVLANAPDGDLRATLIPY